MTYYSKNFSHMMKRRAEKLRGINKYPKQNKDEHARRRGANQKGGGFNGKG